MESTDNFELEELVREIAEIGVGSAILGLRQINIARRKFVEDVPAAAPVVDAVLDQVEALAPPVSAIIGAAVSTLGDAVSGERGDQLHEAGLVLASMGPELLKMTGLTRR